MVAKYNLVSIIRKCLLFIVHWHHHLKIKTGPVTSEASGDIMWPLTNQGLRSVNIVVHIVTRQEVWVLFWFLRYPTYFRLFSQSQEPSLSSRWLRRRASPWRWTRCEDTCAVLLYSGAVPRCFTLLYTTLCAKFAIATTITLCCVIA